MGPSLLRPILVRAASLGAVLIIVLVLLVLTLGVTGYSDRILSAQVGEELRALRTTLSQTVTDPDAVEEAIAARRAELEASFGLDRAWYERLPVVVAKVLTFDLGEARSIRSFEGSNTVSDIVIERLPNTMILLTTSLIITAILGLSIGVWLSQRPGSRADRVVSYIAAITNGLPAWWTGILLILVFGFWLRVLPSGGMFSAPPPVGGIERFLDLLWHAVLPILTLVLVSVGPSIYVIRTMTLDVALQDHVMVARAKGLPERIVARRHILRVAAPPIVTGLILGLAGTLGGAILIETVFSWQGMGRLYFDAFAGQPDEAVIIGLTFMFTLIYVAARLVLGVPLRLPRPAGALHVSRRAILREILRSGAGKLGITLAIILGVTSILVVVTFPLDFGPTRWSNPTVWADHPRAAPPAWTALLPGAQSAEHRILEASEPTSTAARGEARVETWAMPFLYEDDEPPTFVSFSLGPVSYMERPPAFSVVLVRPDGTEVPLLRTVVRGPRPTEEPPIVRHDETPMRVLLTSEPELARTVSEMLAESYGVTNPASISRAT